MHLQPPGMSMPRNFAGNRRQGFSAKPAAPIVHAEDSQPNESIDKRRAVPSLVVPSKSQPRASDNKWAFRGKNRGREGGHSNPPWKSFSDAGEASGSGSNSAFRRARGHPIPPPNRAPARDSSAWASTPSSFNRVPAAPSVHAPISAVNAPPAIRSSLPTPPSNYFTQKPSPPTFDRVPAPPRARTTGLLTQSGPTRNHSAQAPAFGRVAVQPSTRPASTFHRNASPSSSSLPTPTSDSAPAVARPSVDSVSALLGLSGPIPISGAAVIDSPNAPPLSTPTSIITEQTTLPVVPRALSSPPPLKRRRVDELFVKPEESPVLLPPPPSGPSPPSTPVRIKVEARTPSPPPTDPPRRAVTSGSKRYFPVPHDCTRASLNPDYIANRRKWARRECTVLRDLGLHVDKFFFRDDGMVIEWTSAEPVWFDTLRPVRARPRLPAAVVHEIIDVDADEDAVPPPSPRPASPAVSVAPSPLTQTDDAAMDLVAEVEQLTAEDEQAQLQQLSLDFIQKYILTFDHNRASLAAAYTEDAIFSFRDTNFERPTHFTFQRTRPAPNSGSSSKRTMPALPALDGYRFTPTAGTIDVDYDTVALEGAPPQVMLSAHAQLIGPAARTVAISQSFVLRRNVNIIDVTDWPLVAVAHQMVVRDTPWVRWTGSVEELGRRMDG
ncbi:hypothetical protein DFH09DRAFT_205882 [Mycena vulgaris]|nr:hypothetical protein DFH09DRAFT_205882 [Mycena vulgaris]